MRVLRQTHSLRNHTLLKLTALLLFVGPTVASINPANGPTVGGTVVTITGTNFGTSTSVVSATIGGVSSPSCVWTSDSTMECEAPSGIGASNHIVDVTVGGQTSSSTAEFAYDGIAMCP